MRCWAGSLVCLWRPRSCAGATTTCSTTACSAMWTCLTIRARSTFRRRSTARSPSGSAPSGAWCVIPLSTSSSRPATCGSTATAPSRRGSLVRFTSLRRSCTCTRRTAWLECGGSWSPSCWPPLWASSCSTGSTRSTWATAPTPRATPWWRLACTALPSCSCLGTCAGSPLASSTTTSTIWPPMCHAMRCTSATKRLRNTFGRM
mmetsp:Transcript_23750/g.76337  ORF Transcript_23750/g.76337 Transcript_23750/m.76337 type:complete len:204 (-) Transcript_23750:200-811(-)